MQCLLHRLFRIPNHIKKLLPEKGQEARNITEIESLLVTIKNERLVERKGGGRNHPTDFTVPPTKLPGCCVSNRVY
jgi:hypothetical protein